MVKLTSFEEVFSSKSGSLRNAAVFRFSDDFKVMRSICFVDAESYAWISFIFHGKSYSCPLVDCIFNIMMIAGEDELLIDTAIFT